MEVKLANRRKIDWYDAGFLTELPSGRRLDALAGLDSPARRPPYAGSYDCVQTLGQKNLPLLPDEDRNTDRC